ncbi:MAG: Fic family protein [Phycisphaerales bacterium]|nr:Fic family protein [Phycisphaerales bacterium]
MISIITESRICGIENAAGDQLVAKAAGKPARQSTGYTAFMPDPLPPNIQWTETLVRCLSDADRLVGQLAGQGSQLPNPHVLIRPFIRREAVLSSKIEGTQATLGELLAAEAGVVVERSPDDLREVGNYVTALEFGVERLARLPLSIRLVRELHEKLMTGVRGGHATPGEFRRTQNWIGPAGCTLANATYVPPPADRLMECLGDWEKALRDTRLPVLVQAALLHYQFEAIHPFIDGNGRVGRLLITLLLVERTVLPTPLLYLSAFFEATRDEYYRRLLAVSRESAWSAWLEYFLNGAARQAEDALSRAARINQLLARWRRAVAGRGTKNALLLVGAVAENPYVTIRGAADKLGVAFTTAQRAIDALRREKILTDVSRTKRERVFCAMGILDILEEPAKLVPG